LQHEPLDGALDGDLDRRPDEQEKPGPRAPKNKWVNDVAHVLAHRKDLIAGSRTGPYRITELGRTELGKASR
jgi:hypothetical protein